MSFFGSAGPPPITADIKEWLAKNARVVLSTAKGDITVSLRADLAPGHAANFLRLCKEGFYDGVVFHRTIPGFMVQVGCPLSKDPSQKEMHGTGNAGYTLKAEFSKEKHVRGILSAARKGDPDSASCQFFIMVDAAPHLDNQYSVFGKVEAGMDVVDAIVSAPRGARDYPVNPVAITSTKIIA